MKRIFQFVLLICFSFILITCNKNPIVPIDTMKSYTVSGVVVDHIEPGSSPSAKEGVPVVLDNDTAISNSYGEFTFNNIPKGIHSISVLLPNYEPYFDSITILSDTIIGIQLYGIKEDYFPIQVSTQKRFRYLSGAAFIGVSDSGEALWSFDSLKEENGNNIYSVKETLIYTRTINGGNPLLDTMITQFDIIEDSLHKIKIGLPPWDIINFYRFNDYRLGEIIELPLHSVSAVKISIKKNVGLYKMKTNDNMHLSSTRYELIE